MHSFGQSEERLCSSQITTLIHDFNFPRWLESSPQESHTEHQIINGQHFLMEITPVNLEDEAGVPVLIGAVVMLRSTVRMGRQLQTLSHYDMDAFNQIVAVSPKMRHIVEQARKLALLNAPLLIIGDTGTGKDLFAHACHKVAPGHKNLSWHSTVVPFRMM